MRPRTLNNINFKIEKGDSVGIIGESGCGKTTMIKLILGFFPVNSGVLKINGENIVDPQYIEWKTKINTRIGLPEDCQYINAGVLLINIQEYVNHISIENLYKFIEENGSDLIYQDQDTINKIFCNRIKLANVIYNFQVNTIVDTNNYEEARLIHYAGEQKPWKYDFSTPKKGIFYYDYLKRKNQFRKLKKLLLGQYIHNALKYYDDIVKGENSRRLKNYSKKSCLLLFS